MVTDFNIKVMIDISDLNVLYHDGDSLDAHFSISSSWVFRRTIVGLVL